MSSPTRSSGACSISSRGDAEAREGGSVHRESLRARGRRGISDQPADRRPSRNRGLRDSLPHACRGWARPKPAAIRCLASEAGGAIPRLGYLMDARSLYRTLAAIRPAVIYQRVACAYTGICAFYSRRHSVPMIWHVAHDTDVTPLILDRSRNIVRVRLEKGAVRYGARRATQIVVQTEHQAELLERHYGRAPAAVIPNFHRPATETIDKSGPPDGDVDRQSQAVEAAGGVRSFGRMLPRPTRRAIRHGGVRPGRTPRRRDGTGRWERGIESSANLQHLGERSHQEVNELLARAHIFVNTSIHEGFPNTFIQSWQRDVVVVSLSVDPRPCAGTAPGRSCRTFRSGTLHRRPRPPRQSRPARRLRGARTRACHRPITRCAMPRI